MSASAAHRVARVVGASLILAGLLLYQSYENRPILGRWSYPFFGVVLIALLGWIVLGVTTITRLARSKALESAPVWVRFLDWALFAWGLAYLLSTLQDRDNGSRLVDLDLFGSTFIPAIFLEWLSLVLLLAAGSAFIAPKLRSRWREIALSMLALAACGLVLEGAARFKAAVWPATQGFPTYSSRIWAQRYVDLNQQQFRDEALSGSASDVRRLLVVGDSYAFGMGIKNPEERFGETLARLLSRSTGTAWEAVNASRPDSHTRDHLEFLDATLGSRPDLVILLYVFNDIDYLEPVTPRDGVAGAPARISSRLDPFRLLFQNSYAFQEIYIRLRQLVPGGAGGGDVDEVDDSSEGNTSPYRDVELVTRHLTDLSEFVRRVRATGSRVRIVPFDIAVVEPTGRYRYEDFVQRLETADLPVCSIRHAFRGQEVPSLTVNTLDMHPNESAHRLAAVAALPCALQALQGVEPAMANDG